MPPHTYFLITVPTNDSGSLDTKFHPVSCEEEELKQAIADHEAMEKTAVAGILPKSVLLSLLDIATAFEKDLDP